MCVCIFFTFSSFNRRFLKLFRFSPFVYLFVCMHVCGFAADGRGSLVRGLLSADTLVRRKTSHQMDGAPFILGIATILKQLHPTVTQQVLSV